MARDVSRGLDGLALRIPDYGLSRNYAAVIKKTTRKVKYYMMSQKWHLLRNLPRVCALRKKLGSFCLLYNIVVCVHFNDIQIALETSRAISPMKVKSNFL